MRGKPFFHWLAGFIDGEGCFYVRPANGGPANGGGFRCDFTLEVRLDELPILEEIRRETGLGRITMRTREVGAPQAAWKVNKKAECLQLVKLLDEHPLRAKKARDYALWRRAVLLWNHKRYAESWEEIEALKLQMQEERAYRPLGEVVGHPR